MGDGQYYNECVCPPTNQERMMQALMQIIQEGCTDSECIDPSRNHYPTSGAGNVEFDQRTYMIQFTLLMTIMTALLLYFRPNFHPSEDSEDYQKRGPRHGDDDFDDHPELYDH